MRQGLQSEDAWNASSIELAQAAEAHGRLFIVEKYYETVQRATDISPQLFEVLTELCNLYAVITAQRYIGELIRVSLIFHR